VSLDAANRQRIGFLRQFGTVNVVWGHAIAQLARDDPEFGAFYKKFSEDDYKSFGWRDGHTTGIVEGFGVFANAGSITEHWQKHRSELYSRGAKISQIDMNSNYPSTLMKIRNEKLRKIVAQPAIPIPVGGLTTLFTPRIHPAGTCPPECWRAQ
jgi:hypothetical protein